MSRRTVMYKRVSSDQQTTMLQKVAMDKWLADHPCKPVTLEDVATGRNDKRPQFQRLIRAIRRSKVKRVIVYRLDRLGRSIKAWSRFLDLCLRKKVQVISLRESIDLKTATGRLMAALVMSIAEYESELISQRTKDGMAAIKKRSGKVNGNIKGQKWISKKTQLQLKKITRLQESGATINQIAKVLGMHYMTVKRIILGNEDLKLRKQIKQPK